MIRALLISAGLFLLLAALFKGGSEGSVDYSLSKSQEIEKIFQYTASKAIDFKREKGRYPDVNEFESWNEELAEFGLYGEIMDYHIDTYPKEALAKLGPPESNGFVLSVWRGEWFEYYTSWSRRCTLPKDKSDYYMTGSSIKDILSLTGLAIVLFGVAYALVSNDA